MIWLVTGDGPRCGSSMMMHMLGSGGMDLAWDNAANSDLPPEVDRQGYHPNPYGLYELLAEKVMADDFPQPNLYGKVVKLFPWPWSRFGVEAFSSIDGLKGLNHTVIKGTIWMHRSSVARKSSYEKMHCADSKGLLPKTWAWRDACAGVVIEGLKVPGNSLVELDFDTLIKTPEYIMERVAEFGWPVDARQAARAVEPKWRHF